MTKRFYLHLGITVALLTCTFFYSSFLSGVRPVPITKALSSFPEQLGEWRGTTQTMDARTLNILGVEDYMMRTYVDPAGRALSVYVGYYESQSEGEMIHSPKHCLPGAGWQPVFAGRQRIVLGTDARGPVEVNKYIIQKGQDKELVLYWYQSRGRVVANEYVDLLYRIWDSIFRKRSDGALVRLMCAVNPDEAKTLSRMEAFLRDFFPALQQYLPGA